MKRGEKVQFKDLKPGDMFRDSAGNVFSKTKHAIQNIVTRPDTIPYSDIFSNDKEFTFLAHDKELCLQAAKHYENDILPLLRDWPTEENRTTFFVQSGGSMCVLCKEYGKTTPIACKETCPLALAGEWCHRGAWKTMFNFVDLLRAYKTKSEKLKHWQRAERAATYLYELLLHLGGEGERPNRSDFGLEEK